MSDNKSQRPPMNPDQARATGNEAEMNKARVEGAANAAQASQIAQASQLPPGQQPAPKATNPDGRGASNTGDVADQAAADQAAADAKAAELAVNAPGGQSAKAPLQAGANNPADGTPIGSPTNDQTRPDATKGPLHNPGVVVEPGTSDPSPATVVHPGSVIPGASPVRDMTDPSRKH